jgi:ribosomal RNA-processing protein 9
VNNVGLIYGRSVTCLCISEDDQWIFSGSKDGHLIKWSVPEKKKVAMVKRKEGVSKKKKRNKGNGRVNKQPSDPNQCHSSSILAIAVSSDGKFLATGDAEKQIVIWDPATLKKIHIFSGFNYVVFWRSHEI